MTIEFTLPRLLPLTNQLLRMHWQKRRRLIKALAWEIRAVAPRAPAEPFERARVTVTRCSSQPPDDDGLVGGVKMLLDCLVVPTKRNPWGLGYVVDDAPAHIEQHTVHEYAPPRKGRTVVRIEACRDEQ